ncbi:ABC transporter permease [Pimelobacter simplex]|uniref:Putative glutathione transporter, permease component n=1 Tax=Nocardioides simplex TaxID=2045 RepID=A0A0A1DSN6_NOCSI|nr:ABC transporter permease [Pimelobacter simplex]AIY19627.2 Putative glutathione transporter, permease component [Pimelobacter simplex]GEB15033.1 ABC di/oligopeptide transporter inner membrane subunit [Pimelobacter simplex]SFM87337.1 peptide/nickel transport system permease protein [Pimelobacter simplex]
MNRTRLLRVGLKVLRLAAVLLVVSTLCFFSLALLPGDPARLMLGDAATADAVATLRAQLGLDLPTMERFGHWIGGVLQGDLGESYRTGQSVTEILGERAPVTVELIVLSQVIALGLAVPAAIVAAHRRRTGTDRALSLWVFTALSTPDFVVGVVLIWILSVHLGWFPANGYAPWSDGVGPHLSSLIMPAIALAGTSFALYQRVLRADLVETLRQDYIEVARAKGLSLTRITFRHALRPSLLGLSTQIGVTVGMLIGSTVVVESLFGLPGIGDELAGAVTARDYVEVQGLVLVIATCFVLVNALVDVLYPVIDPRLASSRRTRGGAR